MNTETEMKQKMRLTITKIRRQTTSSGGIGHLMTFDTDKPTVTNPIADRNIREIDAPTDAMPDDHSNSKMTKEGEN